MTVFIALEGPDRVGKKTQSTMLKDALKSMGHKVMLVEVPWNDHITYPTIYYMLEHGLASKFPTLFQIVQNMNKLLCQFVKFFEFRRHDYVIFDRWRMSSHAYGTCTGANLVIVDLLFSMLLKPKATVVFVGKKLTDICEDEYESNDSLQHRVRLYYEFAATMFERGCTVINIDSKTRKNIHEEVMFELGKSGLITFRAM
jgi:thymidylate kinase